MNASSTPASVVLDSAETAAVTPKFTIEPVHINATVSSSVPGTCYLNSTLGTGRSGAIKHVALGGLKKVKHQGFA